MFCNMLYQAGTHHCLARMDLALGQTPVSSDVQQCAYLQTFQHTKNTQQTAFWIGCVLPEGTSTIPMLQWLHQCLVPLGAMIHSSLGGHKGQAWQSLIDLVDPKGLDVVDPKGLPWFCTEEFENRMCSCTELSKTVEGVHVHVWMHDLCMVHVYMCTCANVLLQLCLGACVHVHMC